MNQPLGFQDLRHPDHVCLLQCSFYGLKQTPQAWFHQFAKFICMIGFTNSRCDSSVFIYKHGSHTAYVLLYVDDIILTTASQQLLQQVIITLSREFSMIDLGDLILFLGVQVT